MASISQPPSGKYRARYRDDDGKQHASHHDRKGDAQAWLDGETAKLVTGTWTDPSDRKVTVDEWCDLWIDGYARRASTVRQAEVHLAKIREQFGPSPLGAIRPSQVRSWVVALRAAGYSASYVYALHSRLSQVMTDAVHDGLISRSPCSRRTSPPSGEQRAYVATTEQVFGLYESLPARLWLAVFLGAFAGLTTGETCGLRTTDVAFLARELRPEAQWPAEPLKTPMRRTAIPISATLLDALSVQVATWPGEWVVGGDDQLHPRQVQREIRDAAPKVPALPEGFRYHDLRHYFASLLIASGADVKVVQHRLRHSSAKTTLDTYGHLWPDKDESTREAVESVLSSYSEDSLRTERDAD